MHFGQHAAPRPWIRQPATSPDDHTNIWSIGIYTGTYPSSSRAPVGVPNPVLTSADVTDWQVNIVAHPFMVVSGSRYYMFFTTKNDLGKEQSGIGLAESNDGFRWEYKRIVLKEPFVLSYPYFLFKWQNDYYMIPESYTEKFVRLYRAHHSPMNGYTNETCSPATFSSAPPSSDMPAFGGCSSGRPRE